MADLLAYEEALKRILAEVDCDRPREFIPVDLALNRVLCGDLYAPISLPPFDNSAMDGYAINSECWGPDLEFAVSARIPAGDCPKPLVPGTAARIFTGAPVPEGADAVVIQENARVLDNRSVAFEGEVEAGQNIRPAGDDVRQGALAIEDGTRINSRSLGLLSSLGLVEAPFYRPLRVALIATGSEIKSPGQPLAHGEIYNSNYPMIAAELSSLGVELVDFGVVMDSKIAIRDALENAAAEADFVITIGGMSVGGEDHVRDEVSALGDLSLWKVAIKPGKPLGFGTIGKAGFFGLPGNPVSSYVTFFLFVRPALLKASGIKNYINQIAWGDGRF